MIQFFYQTPAVRIYWENKLTMSQIYHQLKMIRWYHACSGFPTKATWIKAIKTGNYSSLPGLIAMKANQYFPESDDVQIGHMQQQRSGIQSSDRRARWVLTGNEKDLTQIEADMRNLCKKHHVIYIKVYNCKPRISSHQAEERSTLWFSAKLTEMKFLWRQ